jgi:apolipoprotein D and lipocalin family protein
MASNRIRSPFLLGVACLVLAAPLPAVTSREPLTTVPQVDLNRYVGTWYEVAHYPNRWQKSCLTGSTEIYTLLDNQSFQIQSSCPEKGSLKQSKSVAKVVDHATCAKLKVTFLWFLEADYWIIALDPDYRYAVVGEPGRNYLWVLSRTPTLSDDVYTTIKNRVQSLGYDPARLLKLPPSQPSTGR